MIAISVIGAEEVVAEFARADSRVRERVDKTVVDQAEDLRQFITREELSGQMLPVRTGKRRTQIVYKIRRTAQSIVADIHPAPGSVLWALGTGMAPRRISVTRKATRVQRRAAKAFGRGYRRRLRRMVGTYPRTHHLHKVPFMELAAAGHRAKVLGAIEAAVWAGLEESRLQVNRGGGEGI